MRKYPPLATSKSEWSFFSVYPARKKEGSVDVAIPRTLFPQSTVRNRLRRQIREAVRLLQKEKRYDLFIRVQKKSLPPFGAIQKEIRTHLEKAQLLP